MKLLILETYNASSSFVSENNPDNVAANWIGNKMVGNVSLNDYMRYEKGQDAKVVYMTPDEYLNKCQNDIFKTNYDSTVGFIIKHRQHIIDKYAKAMINGDKFPIPYLDYTTNNQEGRHRALAVKQAFGDDSVMPVIVIKSTDPTEEEIRKYAEKRWPNDPEWGANYVKAKYDKFYEEPEVEEETDYDDNVEDNDIEELDLDNDTNFNLDDDEFNDAFEAELLDFINKEYNKNYTDLSQVNAITFADAVDRFNV